MARRLLLDENPLFLLPSLAVTLGVNEALILQQFNYWIQASKNEWQGYFWTYNSYREWQKQFPFMSKETIGRAIRKLERIGLVISAVGPNKRTFDRTKWYRIDHDIFDEMFPERAILNDPSSYLNHDSSPVNEDDVKVTPSSNLPTCQTEPTIPDKTSTKTSTDSIASSKKPRGPQFHSRFIFAEMQKELGYPDKTDKDPIPNYGKEAKAIERMKSRGYSEDEILSAWTKKVAARGEFVSMVFVNEDIGKPDRPRQSSFLPRDKPGVSDDPKKYTSGKYGHLVRTGLGITEADKLFESEEARRNGKETDVNHRGE